jgi:hypothetical protein
VLHPGRLRPVDHQRAHIGHRIGARVAEWLFAARGRDQVMLGNTNAAGVAA